MRKSKKKEIKVRCNNVGFDLDDKHLFTAWESRGMIHRSPPHRARSLKMLSISPHIPRFFTILLSFPTFDLINYNRLLPTSTYHCFLRNSPLRFTRYAPIMPLCTVRKPYTTHINYYIFSYLLWFILPTIAFHVRLPYVHHT